MAFFKEYLSCEADDSSYFKDPNSEMQAEWTKRNDIIVSIVTVHGQEFSELKIPYNTVVVVDFADSECEASAKSVTVCARREQ